jgi:DNA polymerase III sliding clamp (beta) subunit (PCNA family)
MQISTRTLVTVAKGAHLAKRDGELIVETTDGHRVAQVRIDCEAGPDFDVIVDRDSWLAVSKIKTTKKDDSTVSLYESNLMVKQSHKLQWQSIRNTLSKCSRLLLS